MSLNLLTLLVGMMIFLVHLTLRVINLATHLPCKVHYLQQQTKFQSSPYALLGGCIALFYNRFRKAEREARTSLNDEFSPEKNIRTVD